MLPLDPGSQARALYLVVLGAALLVMLFARYRGRLGQGLQHAAIWTLIFLGAIVAYGFKEEIGRQLMPAQEMIAEDAVALPRGPDGHYRAVLEVNGVETPFMVDTGATGIVLSRADAERAGIDADALVFSDPAATANGTVFSAPVRIDELRLGPFLDRDVAATVNGGRLHVSLLGMRYLDRFRRVEIEGDRMVLSR